MVVMAAVMAAALRGGGDLTMAAAASFVVFLFVFSLKGYGAFTIYIGFDVAVPTPGGTVDRYGRSAVPLAVKSWRGQNPDLLPW